MSLDFDDESPTIDCGHAQPLPLPIVLPDSLPADAFDLADITRPIFPLGTIDSSRPSDEELGLHTDPGLPNTNYGDLEPGDLTPVYDLLGHDMNKRLTGPDRNHQDADTYVP